MNEVLILSAQDVRALLTIDDCIAAVEEAFLLHAQHRSVGPASLSLHVDGGAFHVKAAAIGRSVAVKVNGNFFDNPARGLPRIQGVIWFNEQKERLWPVNSSQGALDAYRDRVRVGHALEQGVQSVDLGKLVGK